MFGKNPAHEEQGGHGGRPASTGTPPPQKAEMADERAKIAAEEPETHRMEWLSYLDHVEAHAMPLQVTHEPKVGDLGEEVDGSPAMREAGPSERSTTCLRARSPMARWQVVPRGSLRGSTRSRQGTV